MGGQGWYGRTIEHWEDDLVCAKTGTEERESSLGDRDIFDDLPASLVCIHSL